MLALYLERWNRSLLPCTERLFNATSDTHSKPKHRDRNECGQNEFPPSHECEEPHADERSNDAPNNAGYQEYQTVVRIHPSNLQKSTARPQEEEVRRVEGRSLPGWRFQFASDLYS